MQEVKAKKDYLPSLVFPFKIINKRRDKINPSWRSYRRL
jgi:hypothetical protein